MDIVTRTDLGPVARLTLASPANYNALSARMIADLRAALAALEADPAVRVVILAAEGKAFCAGHDLREMQDARAAPDGGAAAFAALFTDCAALMQQIGALRVPVIAQVQGIATAAGCQLVAACDLAIAAEGARFGVNGINIGLFCATPAVALARAIPPRAALELLLTGDFIDADRAEALGLVTRTVPAASLEAETLALARKIAAKLPAAIASGKRSFRAQIAQPLAEAYATAGAAMCTNLMDPDTAEGLQAFLDKRPPNWP